MSRLRNAIAGAVCTVIESLETRTLFGYYSADPIDEQPVPTDMPLGCFQPPVPATNSKTGSSGSSTTQEPVRNFDGVPVVSESDLSSEALGVPWGHTRTWTGLNNSSLNGNGWAISETPYVIVAGGAYGTDGLEQLPPTPNNNDNGVKPGTARDQRLSIVVGTGTYSFYAGVPSSYQNGSYDSYQPLTSYGQKLEWDKANRLLRFTDVNGNIMEFYDVRRASDETTSSDPYYSISTTDPDRPVSHSLALDLPLKYGKFKRYISADGSVEIVANYDANGYVTSLTRSNSTIPTSPALVERYSYSYTGDTGYAALTNDLVTNANQTPPRLIARVSLDRSNNGGISWSTARYVDYTYYTGRISDGSNGFVNDQNGRLGDLKYVEVKNPSGSTISTSYYRYYKFAGEGLTIFGFPPAHSSGPTNQPSTTGGPSVLASQQGFSDVFTMSGLKSVVKNESFARLAATFSNYESRSDTEIQPYINNYFEYERWADHVGRDAGSNENYYWRVGYRMGSRYRIIKEIAQGAGCSTCSGGQGTFKIDYYANNSASDSDAIGFHAIDYNTWRMRTTEYLPDTTSNTWDDNDQKIVYTNELGMAMLEVVVDRNGNTNASDDKLYLTGYRYDTHGRLTHTIRPSALTGYSESFADLINWSPTASYVSTNTGRIEINDYATTTTTGLGDGDSLSDTNGDVAGYLKDWKISQGFPKSDNSNIVVLGSQTYYTHTYLGATVYPIAQTTSYWDVNRDGTDDPVQTSYTYTWRNDSSSVQTNLALSETMYKPTVASARNGSGNAESTTTVYDTFGRVSWVKDEDGHLSYTEYDERTGAVKKQIVDVNTTRTSDFSGLPSGWSNSSGLHLTTTILNDLLGRPIAVTDPNNNVTYTVYNDAAHEVRTYRSGPGTFSQIGPITIRRTYWPAATASSGQRQVYDEDITSSATPLLTNGVPNGTETITASNIQSLKRTLTNDAGQQIESDVYTSMTGITYGQAMAVLGTVGVNYLATKQDYDSRDRVKRAESSSGTITRTLYDARGLVTSTWVGTDDTPTSGYWSPANAAGTNLVQISEMTCDIDGNQTQSVSYPHDGSGNRVTQMYYDWRDRLVATKAGVQGGESTADNTHPITYTEYDNQDRPTVNYTYDGDAVSVVDTAENAGAGNGVPDKPSASLLRTKTTTEYDDQGRSFATHRYSVDPSTGTVSSSSIDTNNWYDQRGNLIKIQASGSGVQKMSYDGAGRQIAVYTTDGGGDSTWADASNVTGDTVVNQTNTTYDAVGNVILTMQKRRFHDATGTGALGRPTSGIRARLYYRPAWYDAANRPIALAEIGTSFGFDYTRSNNPPARSDTKLVTSYVYDAAGRLSSTTDPRGLVDQTYYDLAGRTIQTFENYDDGFIDYGESDSDRLTYYSYDAQGHLFSETAVNALPGSGTVQQQTTQFVYGASQSRGDGLDSNDVLIATQYPSPSTGAASSAQQETYKTNALGERTASTDRNGSTHTYSYDVLGRRKLDAVTTLGSGVDGAVRAIGTSFNTQGLPEKITSYSNAAATTVANEVQRTYTGLGQIAAEYQSHSSSVNTSSTPKVQYGYSSLSSGSRLASMTYPDGRQINYNYTSGLDDAVGRLSSISDAGGVLEGYKYLGMDIMVARTHPQTGVDLSYIRATGEATGDAGDQYTGLDRFNRVVNQKWVNASGTIVDRFTYTYDRDGNVLTKGNPLNTALSAAYTYDGLNRLASDTKNGVADQSWALDALGNSTSVTTGGTAVSRTNNSQNQLTTVGGLVQPYDLNGNQLSQSLPADFDHNGTVDFNDYLILQNNFGQSGKTQAQGDVDGNGTVDFNDYLALQNAFNTSAPATAYAYDAWNRMVSAKSGVAGTVTTEAYAYDGMNRRITNDGTAVYFDTIWQVVEDRNASNATTAQYVWSPAYVDAMIERDADTDGNGTLDQRLYPTQDANWNITAVTDAAGVVQERFDYTAYGIRTVLNPTTYAAITDTLNFRQGFQGGTFEALLPNLILFRNRTYDTNTMRWLQEDPLGALYQDGLNIYAFVNDHPTSSTDPFGLYELDIHYYLVNLLLKARCWNSADADDLAFASQEVDDNPWTNPLHTGVAAALGVQGAADNLREHHFPGSTATTPTRKGDPNVQHALKIALSRYASGSGDLTTTGSLLHAFMDTFSHAGFTAYSWPLPGHGIAGHEPDAPYNDVSKALEAAKALFDTIPSKGCCHITWNNLRTKLQVAFTAPLVQIPVPNPSGKGQVWTSIRPNSDLTSRIDKLRRVASDLGISLGNYQNIWAQVAGFNPWL